ncbi:c-type cytochrome [Catalinimonas niigatensis]|uniref:c-type cytochrome n=1 Tax=Catalinimonas niigatensis TaxID=1397264 RepID=UPI002666E515|nr:cytochrome c [Catalinimonas niigatensis]WPP48863.1 cytochrome c [Catalinimonas niigatensis]
MIRKILKYLLFTLLTIIVVAAAFFTYANIAVNQRFEKSYQIELKPLTISHDSVSLALGEHLSVIKGCTDCHASDLGGKVMVDDPAMGRLVTPNLTKGKGGLPADYSTEDWIKAIRHGLSRENTPLKLMPSQEFNLLTEKDLAALIAYCQSLAPIDRELPKLEIRPVGVLLTHFDKIPMVPAELIDHHREVVADIPNEVSLENGQYLATSCSGCHRTDLKGGDGHIPGSPKVADITGSGNVGKWTEGQFITALRTGGTPEGKHLDNNFMPWQMTKAYTDTELKSLYIYLKSL